MTCYLLLMLTGAYIACVQNPAKPSPPNAGLSKGKKADYGEKQEMFEGTPGGYAWIPVHDPSHAGCSELRAAAHWWLP